ncbi:MAG: glutathione binding-like protein [Pseudomonadota bacterium]
MHVLYAVAERGDCLRLRLTMDWLAVPYRMRWIHVLPGSRAAAPGARDGAVCLRLDGGREIWEPDAMLFALSEGTELAPRTAQETAQTVTWLMFAEILSRPFRVEAPEAALAALEAYLGETAFLVGRRYTIADIAVFSALRGLSEMSPELSAAPATASWARRIRATHGFSDAAEAVAAA